MQSFKGYGLSKYFAIFTRCLKKTLRNLTLILKFLECFKTPVTCKSLGHGQPVLVRDAPVLVCADAGHHVVVSKVAGIVTRLINTDVVIAEIKHQVMLNLNIITLSQSKSQSKVQFQRTWTWSDSILLCQASY